MRYHIRTRLEGGTMQIPVWSRRYLSWCRHGMETLSVLLALFNVQYCGILMLFYFKPNNGWTVNRVAGGVRRHDAHVYHYNGVFFLHFSGNWLRYKDITLYWLSCDHYEFHPRPTSLHSQCGLLHMRRDTMCPPWANSLIAPINEKFQLLSMQHILNNMYMFCASLCFIAV